MNWDEINPKTLGWMKELGNFGPTINAQRKTLKGYPDADAGKTYYNADDLLEMAAACLEVADWLEKRAEREPK